MCHAVRLTYPASIHNSTATDELFHKGHTACLGSGEQGRGPIRLPPGQKVHISKYHDSDILKSYSNTTATAVEEQNRVHCSLSIELHGHWH
jgi:hypothetical protein